MAVTLQGIRLAVGATVQVLKPNDAEAANYFGKGDVRTGGVVKAGLRAGRIHGKPVTIGTPGTWDWGHGQTDENADTNPIERTELGNYIFYFAAEIPVPTGYTYEVYQSVVAGSDGRTFSASVTPTPPPYTQLLNVALSVGGSPADLLVGVTYRFDFVFRK